MPASPRHVPASPREDPGSGWVGARREVYRRELEASFEWILKTGPQLDMVAHSFNPSTRQAEAVPSFDSRAA